MQHLRLTHSGLDFWVDVRLWEWNSKWLAVADLADEPDVRTGREPWEAIKNAIVALSELLASDMAEDAELDP